MAGAAQPSIAAAWPEVVDELVRVGGAPSPGAGEGSSSAWPSAPYDSASAFSFVFDPLAGGDPVDVSAAATEAGVLVDSVVGRPLPPVSSPAPARIGEPTPEVDVDGAFRAGLLASRTDPRTAARHLEAASRQLIRSDPGGAVYVASVAAACHEKAGDPAAGRSILESIDRDLDRPCPALWLHLARLGSDGAADRLAEAVEADPMLEADALALGLQIEPARQVAIATRAVGEVAGLRAAVRGLTSMVDDDIVATTSPEAAVPTASAADHGRPTSSAVDGPAEEVLSVVDGLVADGAAPEDEAIGALPLAVTERAVWSAVGLCRRALERGAAELGHARRARSETERALADARRAATNDLTPMAAARSVAICAVTAVALIASAFATRWLASMAPDSSGAVRAAGGVAMIALVLAAALAVAWTCWSGRHLGRARRSRSRLPALEQAVADRLGEEFALRRALLRAGARVDRELVEILDRRASIVPRRPDPVAFADDEAS